MNGLYFNVLYEEYFKKRFSWSCGIGSTIHDGSFPVYFNDPNNQPIDGSVRYTTAGVQAIGNMGYSFLKSEENTLQIRTGTLIRYQSSSYYDDVTVLYPAGSGLPIPVVIFQNKTPQRTLVLGGSIQLLYNYTLKHNISLGLLAGIQTDTRGDTISQLCAAIGKKF